jgi:hypothetical protein
MSAIKHHTPGNNPKDYTQNTRYCCQILMKLQFSGEIFEEQLNTKFHENPFIESRFVPCGRTDRHK